MDLINRLENIPLTKFHYRLLIITGLGWMFDAMDTGLIAFVLPALAKAWNLTTAQMGLIGSIGLLGMAIGAVLAGFAADRWGRKTMFAVTLVVYSVATGLCGLAWNLESLLFFRFLVGFGLGGQLPVAVTLVSEFSPPASRGRMIVLLESFWAAGWLVAALLSYLVIPKLGWQAAFFMGALPALYVFKIWRSVPESVRYLVEQGQHEQAQQIIVQMEQIAGIESLDTVKMPEKKVKVVSKFTELFSPQFVKRTLMLWVVWFGLVFSYYGIFTWLPSLLVKQGFTIIKTFEYVLIMTIAQLPGYFSAAYLVDRLGRKSTMAIYLAMSAVSAYFFGQAASIAEVLLWGCMISFFNLGAWGIIYTYTPELYPTRIRAMGSGWAAAIGRVGGILAPLIVGSMLSQQGYFQQVFLMFTVVMLGISMVVWLAGEETKGRSLDQISSQK